MRKAIFFLISFVIAFILFGSIGFAMNHYFGSLYADLLYTTFGISSVSNLHVGISTGTIGAILKVLAKDTRKYRHGVEHGSARFGKHKDIKPYIDPDPAKNVLLTKTESIMMNPRPPDPTYARNKNVLVIGGSGSGKTRFFVIPNLMQMHSSYVVTDPKGDIVNACGKMLLDNGYKLKILNLKTFSRSMKYNPFAYIKSEQDVLTLVEVLIANTSDSSKSGGDQFWTDCERLLYTGLIGFIYFFLNRDDHNVSTLVDMIRQIKISEEDENLKNDIDLLFDDAEQKHPGHFAIEMYKEFREKAAGKTAKSVLISCVARLRPFYIPAVKELMEYDEMELDLMGDRKTVLFIITDDTNSTFNFIAAMLYSQLFNVLCNRADEVYGGRLPIHVRCILDEFANLGEIPKFEELITTIRSREISACPIIQSKSQLNKRYKDTQGTIVGNCDVTLFLGGKEKETLEDAVELLGKETIDIMNASEKGGSSGTFDKSYQKQGRDVLSCKGVESTTPKIQGSSAICGTFGRKTIMAM